MFALVAVLAVSGAYAGRGASMRNLHADTAAKQPMDVHALYTEQVRAYLGSMQPSSRAHSLAACDS